jgi:tetratricopeptide (TPR) repeat protein
MGTVEFEEAQSAMRGGDVARAIEVSGLVIGRLDPQKDATALGRFRLLRAKCLWVQGQSSEALQLLEEGERTPELGPRLRAQLKMERAYFCGLLARFSESKTLFDEAAGLLDQGDSRDAVGELQWRRGMVLHFFGDFAASDTCFRTALAIGEDEKKAMIAGLGSAGIAKNLMMSGHPGEAVPWFERALATFEKEGSRLHVAAMLSELGACHFGLDNLEQALELFLKAEQIDLETGAHPGRQIVIANIGNIYLRRGAYVKAISHYQRAIEIAKHSDDRISVYKWLKNLGVAYSAMGNAAIGANFERQAEAMNRVLEEERSRARDAGWEVSAAAPKQSCEQL